MEIKKTLIILFGIVFLLGVWIYWIWPDKNLHVVVCDVGQGDSILISQGFSQILVDGGPDDKVLDCLSRHLVFFDRRIEVMVMTHPQSDHFAGLISVLNRYKVNYFFSGPEENPTEGYKLLNNQLKKNLIDRRELYSGQIIRLGHLEFRAIWPTRDWVSSHMRGNMSDGTDLNGFGIVGRLHFGQFDMLLTADADAPVEQLELQTGLVGPVEVLKVPHHGSKTGMLPDWLDVIRPRVAIISSGKGNKYGHPTVEALGLLKGHNIKIYRTDQLGDVEVVTDGMKWRVKD